ncbi:hypothetical protein CVT26_015981 [Gymnopilus dilepis]|uniref:CHAT domain-containing protein n=1 Tax=Gymnopilus dilepis TaxID=231916 RepID=A0A409XYQ7_9AGAR|nr:hypothetical protein CVT26_015981 [Gymnopilus dilepis]
MAYILFLHARRNHKQAGHMLHTVSLDKEPGHTHFLYQLAASIRETETDEESLDLAAMLLKEFLRVQERGTPLHFLGMVELASTLTLEFLHRGGRLASFAVALELFREATTTRFSEPWSFVAKKTLIIGRVLHNRYRFFEESAERLEEAINILDVLWDIMPLGRPFRVSVVELIAISALLYLSHDLDTTTWLKALKHLTLAVDLHVNGFLEEDIGLDNEDKADIADIVLHDGIDPSGYFYLSTQAMCIVHTADLLRATAYDACCKPGYLRLATDVYKRSLKWRHEGEEIYEAQSSAVAAAWTNEKESLRRAVLSLGRDDPAGFTLLGPTAQSLPVFWYRAVHRTSSDAPKSFSHSCHLLYHPTWVTYLPKQQNEGAPSPLPTISSDTYVPPWPSDFMSLPSFNVESESLDRNQHPLPSTILPGIEKVIEDENSELFRMPLEPRTIRTFMRSLDDEVRGLEKSTSYMSESVIRWSNEPVYWDPKEVHLSTRMAQLKSRGPYFARLAQLQALLSRGPERCLELVESSRTLFWNRLLRLQTSFTGLPEDLASSLEKTASELDRCKSQFTASATEEETKRQWELEGIFNSLLGRARQVPGFEKLLMPKGYEELLQASAGGPVVVLLGNDSTYAALVVRPTGVDAVWLTDLTEAAMEKFIVSLNRASKDARSVMTENRKEGEDGHEERKMGPMKSALMPSYEAYLSGLWKFIAKPVLEILGLLKSKAIEKRPRLWWCPTGRFTFLPIHAAGVNFGKDTFEGVMKYIVSSYTPTLSALIASRKKMERSSRALVPDLTTLVLAQPKTPGHASLPMTLKELETLEEIIPPDLLLRVGKGTLSEANANRKVDEAMTYIEEALILHLACHGHQDRVDPLNSGFELSDGRLSLSKLISCRNPNAFLAFLSACESAANDVDVPDESLNLAAAMLFAGFRSVIGTMWCATMNDSDGPQVAKIVYEELFKKTGVEVSPDAIAYALDIAVQKLQESGIHASRWATYIHVGM